ncbi:hypothetical protein Pan97_07820 [Bremerella volcania]|uniref:YARHG domain-containing protein n=1 Tax=Bremerella volcania TaxID=2527984 RepID=A0A518C3H8_9BACT|nr:hypothetical protein [Bremerella volcania]QDU73782.1 hypothetical protein Pan97_07820 [Bremerella volcania]
MRAFTYWLICMLLIGIMACSQAPKDSAEADRPEVLTVEAWKQLDPSIKFDGTTLEKLRMDNKQFRSSRAWSKFYQEEIRPEMTKDQAS